MSSKSNDLIFWLKMIPRIYFCFKKDDVGKWKTEVLTSYFMVKKPSPPIPSSAKACTMGHFSTMNISKICRWPAKEKIHITILSQTLSAPKTLECSEILIRALDFLVCTTSNVCVFVRNVAFEDFFFSTPQVYPFFPVISFIKGITSPWKSASKSIFLIQVLDNRQEAVLFPKSSIPWP